MMGSHDRETGSTAPPNALEKIVSPDSIGVVVHGDGVACLAWPSQAHISRGSHRVNHHRTFPVGMVRS